MFGAVMQQSGSSSSGNLQELQAFKGFWSGSDCSLIEGGGGGEDYFRSLK